MPDSLTITDNRTGQTYEVPVTDGTIRSMDLRQIKVDDDDFGLMGFDPGYVNTASTRSAITFIDGEKGILRYRGYPIEQLAAKSDFIEVAYLLLHGELPSASQLDKWRESICFHTLVHENIKKQMEAFRYDAHPMGMWISTVAALSTFYPEAKQVRDPATRMLQIQRLIAKAPTMAAQTFRHLQGYPYNLPDNDLSYTANFLSMMFRMTESKYEPHPALVKALDVLYLFWIQQKSGAAVSELDILNEKHAVVSGLDSETWSELRDIFLEKKLISQSDRGAYLLSRDLHGVTFSQLKEWVNSELPLNRDDIQAQLGWQQEAHTLLRDQRQQQRGSLNLSLAELFSR